MIDKLKKEMDAILGDYITIDGNGEIEELFYLLEDIGYLQDIVVKEIKDRSPELKRDFEHPFFSSKNLTLENYYKAKNNLKG